MASTFKRIKGRNTIHAVSFHSLKRDRRFSYHVGPDKTTAKDWARQIERLERFRVSGGPPDDDMIRWLERLPGQLRDKLVTADLIDGHTAAAGKSMSDHLADFARSLQGPPRRTQILSRWPDRVA